MPTTKLARPALRSMTPSERALPTIVLVRPLEEGNVGAVARAMANTGFCELILVEPAPVLGGTARGFGVGGWDILDSCRRSASLPEALAGFQRIVGTSSGRGRPFRQLPSLEARELPDWLATDPPETRTAILFGPEDSGLGRSELELCHAVATIPAAMGQPTLNLSQAVLIITYELFLSSGLPAAGPPENAEPPATAEEVASLLGRGDEVLLRLGYDQETIRAGWVRDLRSLLLRAAVTTRETRALWRLLNRVSKTISAGPTSESGE